MRRASQLLLLMLFAVPAWCARQSGQNPPASPPSSSSSAKPSPSPPAPQKEIAPSDPPNAAKDIDVASYYMRKGDMNAAIPRLQEAVQLKPKYAKPRLMLAEAYERAHDKDSAVKTYQDYLKAFPNASDAKKIQKKIEKLSSER
ncbi:MAG: tetratricopeptide repeat protein [Candidatus Acidiferrales bacterium]